MGAPVENLSETTVERGGKRVSGSAAGEWRRKSQGSQADTDWAKSAAGSPYRKKVSERRWGYGGFDIHWDHRPHQSGGILWFIQNSKLATYAARCIDNELLMMLRKQKKDIPRGFALWSDRHRPGGKWNQPAGCYAAGAAWHRGSDGAGENLGKLSGLIDTLLTEREKEIICLRYGLYGGEEVTQREIGKKLDISRSYVSGIEKGSEQAAWGLRKNGGTLPVTKHKRILQFAVPSYRDFLFWKEIANCNLVFSYL